MADQFVHQPLGQQRGGKLAAAFAEDPRDPAAAKLGQGFGGRAGQHPQGAVVGTFGVLTDALVDLVRGAVAPSGRLPYAIPANRDAVLGKASDIPGADEPAGYAYTDATGAEYTFGYGLHEF